VIFCLLSISIVAAGPKKGDKEFKEGMKHEAALEWDHAAEQFALAVTANPKNAEYRLHLQRALFNASQMFVQRGNALAEQKDYVGAYNAFRKAYAYDPTNQLAKAEMERMVRLQGDLENGIRLPGDKSDKSNGTMSLVQAGYRTDESNQVFVSQKLEKVGNYKYAEGSSVKEAIKQLAEELDLNVLFDRDSQWENRKFGIALKDVSAARALDYIFKQEGLFFQKIGPKTILVAAQARRQFFTELVLRTFYLGNANPDDVAKIIQQAIPVQPGRTQTFVQIDKSTNSLTIRDTEENIRLMEKLIKSLDKDRAEVVMDVNIYEVNKKDLLQLGNQIGTNGTLGNLGGFTGGLVTGNDALDAATNIIGKGLLNQAMGAFLSVPGSTISALQTKSNTKLIASTQVHAFNNEESMARIGQRVPVKSAQFFTGNNNNVSNGVVGDVFNYEQVGLTLKFTPIVFPNQDVQVKMSIESKDVSGEQTTTPTFSERSITGTARVQNNKTLLLASVAQGITDKSRVGLPLLGLIPILGRLFSTPSDTSRQVDIVIAVTPRVLRAPIILPEDEEMRPTGSVVSPTSGSLEAMVYQEEKDEYLASVRRSNTSASLRKGESNNVVVQLPDRQEVPGYVPKNVSGAIKAADGTKTGAAAGNETVSANTEPKAESAVPVNTGGSTGVNLRPIETNVRTLDISQAFNASDKQADKPIAVKQTSLVETPKESSPQAEFRFGAEIPEITKGTKMIVPVLVKSETPFRLAILALKYDEQKLAVRGVTYGEIFGAEQSKTSIIPYLNKGGRTFVSLNSASSVSESGVLAYIEIEALADGKPQISFDGEAMNILSPGGANFALNFK
jgi:general secretion pathway protein D